MEVICAGCKISYRFGRHSSFKGGFCRKCQEESAHRQSIESSKNQMADEMVKGKSGLMTMAYKSDDEGEAK